MKYDTFICYRGKATDNGISYKIAEQIDKIIRDDTKYGNVFFAPRMPNYNFIEDAADIIKDVSLMIVVLCPHFFDGFENLAESSVYHEFLAAFSTAKCKFFPVFTYGFQWSDSKKELMDNLYGKECARRLYHMTGVSIPGDVITPLDLARISCVNSGNVEQNEEKYNLALFRREEEQCGNTILSSAISFNRENDCVTGVYGHRRQPSKFFIPSEFMHKGEYYFDLCD